MEFNEHYLGTRAAFLLPSLKLKAKCDGDSTFERSVHAFLLSHFDGYTATTGNLIGYWKDQTGNDSYGEHRLFAVALHQKSKLSDLKSYLASLAGQMREECIYLEVNTTR